MSKSTKFNTEWLKDPQFSSWVGVDPNSNVRARCVLCGVKVELGNMGRQALTSHSKGKKHLNKAQMSQKIKHESQSLTSFLVKPEPSGSDTTTESNINDEVDVCELTVPPPQPLPTSGEPHEGSSGKKGTISNFITNDQVLTAEMLWALKIVVSHYSCSSSAKTNCLFQKMFPDSQIARKFSCGSTKSSYLIRFGLAPFFKDSGGGGMV